MACYSAPLPESSIMGQHLLHYFMALSVAELSLVPKRSLHGSGSRSSQIASP